MGEGLTASLIMNWFLYNTAKQRWENYDRAVEERRMSLDEIRRLGRRERN